jgi:glycosyltransferase involved in cell wall biosynthesis
MKRALIITSDFPPQAGTGITRVTRLFRYLPDFDWQPVVVTSDRYGGLPDDEARHVHRAGDLVHNLFKPLRRGKIRDVPPEKQYLIPTIPNQSLFGRLRDQVMVPDTKLGWLPGAVRLGQNLIDRYRPDVIFSTSPPETAHLVGLRLHQATGLPWVADLRDGWLYEPPQLALRRQWLRSRLEGTLERQAILGASAIVVSTGPIGEDLCARYPQAAGRVTTITNGFDQADFASIRRQRPADGRFLLVYTGALGAGAEGRSADPFFDGLAMLTRQRPELPLRVRFVGNIREQEKAAALARGLAPYVEFLPPVSRHDAHQQQRDADALLLVTAPGRRSEATSKLYEYIAAGAPILALAQGNAAAEIVSRYELGVSTPADQPAAIAAALEELIQAQAAGKPWPGFAEAQRRFEWHNLAGQMAALFDSLSGQTPGAARAGTTPAEGQ